MGAVTTTDKQLGTNNVAAAIKVETTREYVYMYVRETWLQGAYTQSYFFLN